MKTENNVPLYKVLNNERTQGEWIKDGLSIATGPDPKDETIFLTCDGEDYPYPTVYERSRKEARANAEYTALAVNNLHLLAEALQRLLKEARFNSFTLNGNVEDTPAERQAQEALNRIS